MSLYLNKTSGVIVLMYFRKVLFIKLTILMVVCGVSFGLNGQVVNGGFEIIDSTKSESWILEGFGSRIDSNYARTGSKSLSIWTWYHYVSGRVFNGQNTSSFPDNDMDHAINYGTPLSQVPMSLDGYYMYDTSNTVSSSNFADVLVICKRFNFSTGLRDTVAMGRLALPSADTSLGFVPFSVPIEVLMPGVQPDSIVIVFQSYDDSEEHSWCSGEYAYCMLLYLDDLTLNLPTGVIDAGGLFENKVLYPNPSSDLVYVKLSDKIQSISIFNQNGSLVWNQIGNISKLNTGMYNVIIETETAVIVDKLLKMVSE